MVSQSFVKSILDEVVGLFSNNEVVKVVEEIAEKGKNAAIDLVVDIIPLPLPRKLLRQIGTGLVKATIDFVTKEEKVATAKALSTRLAKRVQ